MSPSDTLVTAKTSFFSSRRFKQIITVLVICGLSYGGYVYFFKKTTASTQKTLTETVKLGTIEDSIKTTGTANLVNEQKIRFNQIGKVTAINVKQGDTVKKGDIIAVLDSSDVQNSIKQAEINLSNARISLATDLKPAEQKDLLQAQNTIEKSKSDIANAQKSLSNTQLEKSNKILEIQNNIASKKASIAANQTDIDNKTTTYQSDIASKTASLALAKSQLDTVIAQEGKSNSNTDTDIKKALSTALTDTRKQLIDAQALLLTVDEVFGVTEANKSKSDSYRQYLSSQKSRVEFEWLAANTLLQKYNDQYTTVLAGDTTTDNINPILSGTSDLYYALVTLGADAAEVIKSGTASTSYSQSTIDSQYSSMMNIKSQAQSTYDTIQSTKTNILKLSDPALAVKQSQNTIDKQTLSVHDAETAISNAQKEYMTAMTNLKNTGTNLKNDLTNLENSLSLTTKNYDAQITQAEANIKNLESTLKVNIANYDYIKKGATTEKIQMAKNDIAKQEISLADVKKSLDKYRIEAPFDGVIRQIDFKVGDNLISDDTKYVYIDNPNYLEISATLDQIDIAKVQVGQGVDITFDSFSTATFTGSVTQINSTPISTSGVTSYTIKIAMEKKDYKIYSGMTAKLTIVVSKKENIIVIPTEYITTGSGSSTVILKDSMSPRGKKTEVVTGTSTTAKTEIVSGLKEGDIILRFVNTSASTSSSSSSSALKTASRASSGGGMGGPPGGF